MSDFIGHKCGIALVRLKRPLESLREHRGDLLWGLRRLYLLMEKQRNRGQDGAGIATVKFDMPAGEPFLMRQIALVQPRIILAMGRFAVQALLRTDAPIGRLRGQVHSYQGVPLVVTYHPAYLLRNLPDKAKAWADLCLAAEVLAQADAAGGQT